MTMDRRTFVMGTALTAAASTRVWGANDRLRIAIVGPGTQGRGLLRRFLSDAEAANAEMVAVCDLWTKRRDEAAAQVKEATGREPQKLQYYADVLPMKDLDGVILATPDHQHARQLVMAIEAKKDVFCEKPMGNVLSEVKAAYHTVTASKQVVQLGTQGLSLGRTQLGAQFIQSGRLGAITRVSHNGSFNGPRWSPIAAVKEIREADTDWKAWLMGRRDRPFDPRLYFEFRLYREFSNGIADQWLTHAASEVHAVMDDYFPVSAVASGGVLLYKDGRENCDTFQVTFTYPKGFLFDYFAMFGNDYPGHLRFHGQNGTMERAEGGDGGYAVRGIGGGERAERIAEEIKLMPPKPPSHVQNWLDCVRSRQTPNADVRSGYAHSVASMMAARAEITGKAVYWDATREEIVEQRPA
jgi:predicted dehydrogenase